MPSGFSHRIAQTDDIPALEALMARAIDELQQGFLNPAQIAASHALMGLDRSLIADGSYFIVEQDGRIAGCGGWSARATPFGGTHSPGRDERLLNPASEAARIRAMYTHPDFARRGIGRLVLGLGEAAAKAAGFRRLELTATLAGLPLYRAYGFVPVEALQVPAPNGVVVPLMRMEKPIR